MTSNDSVRNFAVKTAIVAVAVIGALWVTLDHVDDLIEQRLYEATTTLKGATTFRPGVFWPHLAAGIVKAADPANDLSPEKKAQLVAAVRVLRARWKPVLDAALTDPVAEPPKPHK